MKKLILILVVAFVAHVSPVALAEPPTGFDALTTAYDSAVDRWFKKNKKPAKRDWSTYPIFEYLPKFQSYVKEHRGTREGLDALVWVLQNTKALKYARMSNKDEIFRWAIEALNRDYAKVPGIEADLPQLREFSDHFGPKTFIPLFEQIIKNNPGKEARTAAKYSLAFCLGSDFGRMNEPNPAVRTKDRERALELFRQVVAEAPQSSLADSARRFVYEIENIRVGKKAPEIEGIGIDGKPLKLSQFRGKVVMLDFYKFGCEHCDELHEHAQIIVAKMKDRPFVWLGVNANALSRLDLKKRCEVEGVTWPSFADGVEGKIREKWNVDSYPTTFLIDEKGVIRSKNTNSSVLTGMIETMVRRAELAADRAKQGPGDKTGGNQPGQADKGTAPVSKSPDDKAGHPVPIKPPDGSVPSPAKPAKPSKDGKKDGGKDG